jgi:hypothetical protein
MGGLWRTSRIVRDPLPVSLSPSGEFHLSAGAQDLPIVEEAEGAEQLGRVVDVGGPVAHREGGRAPLLDRETADDDVVAQLQLVHLAVLSTSARGSPYPDTTRQRLTCR